MKQLPLDIRVRPRYRPEAFVLHSGVAHCYNFILKSVYERRFGIFLVTAPTRYGKTHLALRLYSDLTSKVQINTLFKAGYEFKEWLDNFSPHNKLSSNKVIIVDESEKYFTATNPGASGKFVEFIESSRTEERNVIFLSSMRPEYFPCDDHIMSRLKEAHIVSIAPPDDESIPEILYQIGRQWGVNLSKRNISFLQKRLRRDIPALEQYLFRLLHLSKVMGVKIGHNVISEAL
ncbi:MAG: hypothetical protein D6808_06260 [Candidatus Dadabacteria bacterium]|nr:MAG: hypothetical protein D6808_06260 [Candidatus Dadabacteria bacterium]